MGQSWLKEATMVREVFLSLMLGYVLGCLLCHPFLDWPSDLDGGLQVRGNMFFSVDLPWRPAPEVTTAARFWLEGSKGHLERAQGGPYL